MTITYSKPNLNGHKVLYKGRRFWVFKVSEELPFRGSEKIDEIVVYDGFYDVVVCYCHINKNGEYEGLFPYGQQDLRVSGITVRDIVDDVTKTIRWSERH
jgi:hypothetical protein